MTKMTALLALLACVLFASVPSFAAEYQGRLLDGHPFRAMIYGPQGAEPGIVYFSRDEAQVQLLDGEQLLVVLYNRSFDDTHFITGKSLNNQFYRIDLMESAALYGIGNSLFTQFSNFNMSGDPGRPVRSPGPSHSPHGPHGP